MTPRWTAPARRTAALAAALVLVVVVSGCSASRPPAGRPAPGHTAGAPANSGTPTPNPAGGAPPQQPASGNPFLARVPHFPPPPKAQPVSLHGGPQAPFFTRLPTTQPVAFLTMDDGWIQSPDAIALMQAADIPFTMFLIAPVAARGAAFFKQLVAAGGSVGDHTITHPNLRGRSYANQHHEICDSATTLTQTFGQRPQLFRPPFGEYDATTLRVAHDCGYTAVLNWSETVDKGIVRYQTAEHRIHPGDIILMHFRPAFVDDVLAALRAIAAAGLTPAVLTDYLISPHA